MAKNIDNGYLMDRRERAATRGGVLRLLYNPEDRSILGRTPLSWAQILVFYAVFYAVLAALFAFCMWVFFQTLDPRAPKWKLGESLVGTNPGLGFRPMPSDDNVESTLIWYRGTDRENYKYWTKSLEEFLEVYRKPGLTPGKGQNIYNCDYDRPPGRGQVCNVDIRNWHPCTVENEFNYHKAAPCVFLKLNRVYGWVPEYYNTTASLPDDMPASLKNHIANVSITKPHELNTIWVSCEGENPADIENLGPISYIPRQGFPGYYYPYENSEGYLSPLVAIHISNPRNGIIINVECKAWAKNINHNRQFRLGSVHFELMID